MVVAHAQMSAVKDAEGVWRFDVPGRCVVPDQADEEQERPEVHGAWSIDSRERRNVAPWFTAASGVASLAAGAGPPSLRPGAPTGLPIPAVSRSSV